MCLNREGYITLTDTRKYHCTCPGVQHIPSHSLAYVVGTQRKFSCYIKRVHEKMVSGTLFVVKTKKELIMALDTPNTRNTAGKI